MNESVLQYDAFKAVNEHCITTSKSVQEVEGNHRPITAPVDGCLLRVISRQCRHLKVDHELD